MTRRGRKGREEEEGRLKLSLADQFIGGINKERYEWGGKGRKKERRKEKKESVAQRGRGIRNNSRGFTICWMDCTIREGEKGKSEFWRTN